MITVRKRNEMFGGVLVALFAFLLWATFVAGSLPIAPSPVLHASEQMVAQVTMLNAQSAINTTGTVVGSSILSKCRESAIYLIPSISVSAGAIQVESSHDAAFTGTWAPMGSTITLVANTLTIVQITGIHLNLRTRISTGVTLGSVTTIFVCN